MDAGGGAGGAGKGAGGEGGEKEDGECAGASEERKNQMNFDLILHLRLVILLIILYNNGRI